jgi:hypothetical protein
MAYSQGAQKTDILKEVSFWVNSSYTGVKTDSQKQVPVNDINSLDCLLINSALFWGSSQYRAAICPFQMLSI